MKKYLFILILFTVGVIGSFSTAQAEFDRSLEPIILEGSTVAEFMGKAISGVRVYSYSADQASWEAIPFQIDEFKPDSDNPNGAKDLVWQGDGIFAALDELVFMAMDAGDKVPDDATWPDDIESKWQSRYEIAVIDPLTAEMGYVYVFYSSTLAANGSSYVKYKSDYIRTGVYGIGHDTDNAGGLPDSLAIVGSNIDFLDSWRIRAYIKKIVVEADLGFGAMPLEAKNVYISEDRGNFEIEFKYSWVTATVKAKVFHDTKNLKVKEGPVRVLRENILGIRFQLEGILDDTTRIPILNKYYKNSVHFRPAFSFDLGDDVKTIESDYVAFGIGLDTDARFMKFYGPDLTNADGKQDSLIDKSSTGEKFEAIITSDGWPGSHWVGYSAGHALCSVKNASMLEIIDLNGQMINSGYPALTFYDYLNSELNPNIYGMSALRIYDWSKPPADIFEIDSNIRYYYFAENQTRSEMQQIFDKYKDSSALSVTKQAYDDQIPPKRVDDLAVSDRTETSMTISWTAPGDDGDIGGPAKTYFIRYSATAPNDPPGGFDWDWWSSIAENVPNIPAPAEPGTTQSVTVTGLSEATTYYFRMNVVDHGGNVAGLSNVASMWTTPVELSSFVGRVTNENIVLLEWSTASESNNLGFHVERRLESADWQDVGFVKGVGTTSDQQYYTFSDVPGASGDWNYRLKQVDADGTIEYSDPITVSIATPQQFALAQNYPNPFNPETTITFEIPEAADGQMKLIIYDMLGRAVRTLVNEQALSGFYNIKWDGTDDAGVQTSSGVYVYRLVAGDFTATKKMIKLQ
jgi:hypothetical protein